jgi:hypothetical protein
MEKLSLRHGVKVGERVFSLCPRPKKVRTRKSEKVRETIIATLMTF